MKHISEIKHAILMLIIISIIGVLSFSLEESEFNDISKIDISGNKYLSSEQYIEFARLNELDGTEITTAIIRDRLSKHPYLKTIDVICEERGIVNVTVFEKKIEAVLLQYSNHFLITDLAEIIPLIRSTSNIDVPVIICNSENIDAEIFASAKSSDKLYCALKILSAAEVYDPILHKSISEIDISDKNISLQLMNISSPIYFGIDDEIEKTVYLSKIFKHMKQNKFTEYLKYVDLRFNELVYLGFDDQIANDKENI